MDSIYLDHNSTTPIDPGVAATIAECYEKKFVNPESQHQQGQYARSRLEIDRTSIIRRLGGTHSGMQTDTLIVTSGGTESNNLAITGLALANLDKVRRVLISSVEHPSVIEIGNYLKSIGYEVELIPVDHDGVCKLEQLELMLSRPTALVSVMLANHETGVLQPIRKIAALCRQYGTLLHTDAVQAVGKIPVNFADLGVDALTFAPHKFCGPRGVGGLLLRHGVTLQPMLFGGYQQMGLRPGTEDVALVAGMNKALELCMENLDHQTEHLATLRKYLLARLHNEISDIVVNGGDAEKVPQTLNVSLPGIDRQAFLMAADMNGIAISAGSACASGSSEPSPVLMAMNADKATISGAIRISVGRSTTKAEIDRAADCFTRIFNSLSSKN